MEIKLPEWTILEKKALDKQALTPIERFVYDNEPAGFIDYLWRRQLLAALKYAAEVGHGT